MVTIVIIIMVLFIVLFTISIGYWMGAAMRFLFRQEMLRKHCTHPRLIESRWVENDGTCMVRHLCPDCSFYDCGPVYADPETWANES